MYLPEQRARSHTWRSLGAPYGPHTLPFVGTTCKDEMSSLPPRQPSMEHVCRRPPLARSARDKQTDTTLHLSDVRATPEKCQSEEIKRVYHVIFTFNMHTQKKSILKKITHPCTNRQQSHKHFLCSPNCIKYCISGCIASTFKIMALWLIWLHKTQRHLTS